MIQKTQSPQLVATYAILPGDRKQRLNQARLKVTLLNSCWLAITPAKAQSSNTGSSPVCRDPERRENHSPKSQEVRGTIDMKNIPKPAIIAIAVVTLVAVVIGAWTLVNRSFSTPEGHDVHVATKDPLHADPELAATSAMTGLMT